MNAEKMIKKRNRIKLIIDGNCIKEGENRNEI